MLMPGSGPVPVRNVGLDLVGASRAAHVHVGDDADDGEPGRSSPNLIRRPIGSSLGQMRLRHRLVDDDERRRSRDRAEHPPAPERDLHRVEVVRADDAVPDGERVGTASCGAGRPSIRKSVSLSPPRRHDGRQRRLRDPGKSRSPLEDGVVERQPLFVGLVSDRWRQHESGEHAIRIEPEVRVLQSEERPDQQTAADEQHQRQRDLGDDQQRGEPGHRRRPSGRVRLA